MVTKSRRRSSSRHPVRLDDRSLREAILTLVTMATEGARSLDLQAWIDGPDSSSPRFAYPDKYLLMFSVPILSWMMQTCGPDVLVPLRSCLQEQVAAAER